MQEVTIKVGSIAEIDGKEKYVEYDKVINVKDDDIKIVLGCVMRNQKKILESYEDFVRKIVSLNYQFGVPFERLCEMIDTSDKVELG